MALINLLLSDADANDMDHDFVEFLDAPPRDGECSGELYRVVGTDGGLRFERFTGDAWVKDLWLADTLEEMGLVRVTARQAESIQETRRGDPDTNAPSLWAKPDAQERRFRTDVAYGMLEIAIYLTKQAAFAAYCDERDGVSAHS